MDLDDQELEATRNNFYLKSEKEKIIDLENEISFLKDALCEKQKEIEEKSTIIMAGAEKVKQLKEEIEELKLITRQYNSYCINTDDNEPRIILAHKHYFDSGVFTSNFISKDKIREVLKDLDEFDDYFFNVSTLKEAIKNALNELLEEN